MAISAAYWVRFTAAAGPMVVAPGADQSIESATIYRLPMAHRMDHQIDTTSGAVTDHQTDVAAGRSGWIARLRRPAAVAVGVALVGAVLVQWTTVSEAVLLLRTVSGPALAALVVLAVLDRLLRAELVRFLLPGLSLARAEVVADVGAAATKGLPLGGPLGTVLRWQIARERGVDAVGFVTMLVATGVAAAFVAWGAAMGATIVDLSGRSATTTDLVIVAICSVVLGGAVVFWSVLLRWERAERWVIGRSGAICRLLSRPVPALADADPEPVVIGLRTALRRIAGRPVPLFARMVLVQATGALIMWVALQAFGTGAELGGPEFARVFFVAHVVGSFAPTPGGVGFMEAGLTGALVAAGVAAPTALAAVLVYRCLTFVLPIIVGTVLYTLWQRRRRTGPAAVQGRVDQPVTSAIPSTGSDRAVR
ncbi:MAG: lysylphosphatidylglycerol synthase domain-containing protein [Actinomycetota bacterium]